MLKRVLIICLCLVVVCGVVIGCWVSVTKKRWDSECALITDAFIATLSGREDLPEGLDAEIADMFGNYLTLHTVDDDELVLLCSDVSAFNAYLQKYILREQLLSMFAEPSATSDEDEGDAGFYTVDGEPISVEYAEQVISMCTVDDAFYDSVDTASVGIMDEAVLEYNNQYYIRRKDLRFDGPRMYIHHNGFTTYLNASDYLEPCYAQRASAPATVVESRGGMWRKRVLCVDVTDASICLNIKRSLTGKVSVSIGERADYYRD